MEQVSETCSFLLKWENHVGRLNAFFDTFFALYFFTDFNIRNQLRLKIPDTLKSHIELYIFSNFNRILNMYINRICAINHLSDEI